ncbi:MAG: hypothetical protein K2Q12_06565 [Rickettsiales bacterium]|nr:hypothetical protein [Rickettsiales bacterium]
MLSYLTELSWGAYLVWAMMAGVLAGLVFYFRWQSRYWKLQLQSPNSALLHHLHQISRARGWMICYLWGLLSVSIVFYDLRDEYRRMELVPLSVPQLYEAPATQQAQPVTRVMREIEIDKIKTYFEDAYVTYYFLNKCGVARAEDNNLLYGALLAALTVYQAKENASQIMSAARGSYEVIYSQTGCNAEKIAALQQRFESFMTTITQQTLPPASSRP